MLVIDAQIIHGYYQVAVLSMASCLSGNPQPIIDSLGSALHANLDSSGHIEHEWRSLVPNEWFQEWLADMLIDDKVRYIQTETCQSMIRQLRNNGFPRTRDTWYIRTAKAVYDEIASSIIITEDLDFYQPTAKGCSSGRRSRILRECIGNICRILSRHGIVVRSIVKYLDDNIR